MSNRKAQRVLSRRRVTVLSYLSCSALVLVLLVLRNTLLKSPESPGSLAIGRQAQDAAFKDEAAFSSTAASKNASLSSSDASQEDLSSVDEDLNPSNLAPITEIYIQSCTFPPGRWNTCSPPSSPAEEAVRGPWIRLDRDLNKRVGLWYNYIFYRRRLPGSPLPGIRNIQLLTPNQAQSDEYFEHLREGGWKMAQGESLTSGIWREKELNLWTTTQMGEERYEPITQLQVIYGKSALRENWVEIGTVSHIKNKDPVKLQALRGNSVISVPKDLRFRDNGNFTILQIADLHFSVGDGVCRDIQNETACPTSPEASDQATLDWLGPVIDFVQPDLVVLSGDQLNGQETSWDAASVLYKINSLFLGRNIPWTAIFGNHDSEATDVSRRRIMEIMQTFSNFVGSSGPEDVDGAGNYVLSLKSPETNGPDLFTLYFLDSHSSHKNTLFSDYTYDWIKQSQIDWFRTTSNSVKPLLRPYEGKADLSHEEGAFGIPNDLFDDDRSSRRRARRSKKRQSPGQTLRKPNAMAFFHIPLPEAYKGADLSKTDNSPLSFGSTDLEGVSSPEQDEGFFVEGLLSQSETGPIEPIDHYLDVESALPEVKVLVHGHSHLRDACQRVDGIWMCFAGGSSYSGYGLRGFDRRVRVFSLSDWGETISTYKLLDGSGEGDRNNGIFASLSAGAAKAAATAQNLSTMEDPDGISQSNDFNHDELETAEGGTTKAESDYSLVSDASSNEQSAGDRHVTASASYEAVDKDTLENIIEEMSHEQEHERPGAIEDWRRSVTSRQSSHGSYHVLDYTTLVGEHAVV